MATVKVLKMDGKPAGDLEVSETLLAADINLAAVRQSVDAYLANQRVGTHSTRTRGEMRGGGAKPWRQKGTGRARAGTNRSPIWRGGAITFGPKPRSYRKKVNKKTRSLAFRSVLTDKLQSERLTIIDALNVADSRLKNLRETLSGLGIIGKTLIVTTDGDPSVALAARNLPGVQVQVVNAMNVYEMLHHDNLLVTQDALKKMEEMWG